MRFQTEIDNAGNWPVVRRHGLFLSLICNGIVMRELGLTKDHGRWHWVNIAQYGVGLDWLFRPWHYRLKVRRTIENPTLL